MSRNYNQLNIFVSSQNMLISRYIIYIPFKKGFKKSVTLYRYIVLKSIKILSAYTKEVVECGGKQGDSVLLQMSGCRERLYIYEMSVHGQGHKQVEYGE